MIRYVLLLWVIIPFVLFAQNEYREHAPIAEQLLLRKAFQSADNFMEIEQYDSAQAWLNRIDLKIHYRKPTLFSYYLTSRQAEIFYYNNLHELGLQESWRALHIANSLKDSVLQADAYNFLGLFYLTKDSLAQSVLYLKKGLTYVKQPPYATSYIELSKPHHIYGNLAEAFEKKGEVDSALYYGHLSLTKAIQIKSSRGEATASLSLGIAYLLNKQPKHAQLYFEKARSMSKRNQEVDIELNTYGGLAECVYTTGDKMASLQFLDQGLALLHANKQLNDFFSLMFLDKAIEIYSALNQKDRYIEVLNLKSKIQQEIYSRNNKQIQSLLIADLENERLFFNLELAASKQQQAEANVRLYISLLLLLLLLIVFFAYRYFYRQRLQLAQMRSHISQDLHDEIGATLSGIAMYSYIAKQQVQQEDTIAVSTSLDVIKVHAGEMVSKLNDIVWAVNPAQDTLKNLISRLKDFSLQLCGPKGVHVEVCIPRNLDKITLNMIQRKNIYLMGKEIIHNAFKYSNCKELKIELIVDDHNGVLSIKDDGNGFDLQNVRRGNGLDNIEARAHEIDAKVNVVSNFGGGTLFVIQFKIPQKGILYGKRNG
ncbi:tetratricopeptide repeat-containing sensor histidine kinase [Sphingobacterium sp. LRF_L2]|uniref:tetratricopeptide repeat-containing sensor histidine kinase n=1 Tax=Sphingobacterium sp. LRF_L2 TaxID=3369421 RepID=UPI003F61C74B